MLRIGHLPSHRQPPLPKLSQMHPAITCSKILDPVAAYRVHEMSRHDGSGVATLDGRDHDCARRLPVCSREIARAIGHGEGRELVGGFSDDLEQKSAGARLVCAVVSTLSDS